MRVLILKLGAGPGGVRVPGDTPEVPDDEGRMLIADGAARLAQIPAPSRPAAGAAALETAEATWPVEVEAAVTPAPPKGGVAKAHVAAKAKPGKR